MWLLLHAVRLLLLIVHKYALNANVILADYDIYDKSTRDFEQLACRAYNRWIEYNEEQGRYYKADMWPGWLR